MPKKENKRNLEKGTPPPKPPGKRVRGEKPGGKKAKNQGRDPSVVNGGERKRGDRKKEVGCQKKRGVKKKGLRKKRYICVSREKKLRKKGASGIGNPRGGGF